MANLPAVAADGVSVVYLKSFGTGTDVDPFVPGQALIDGDGNFLTSLALGTERALTVALVDASGNQILNFGGDATAANQVTANNSLASIDGKLSGTLTVSVSNFPATQAISAVSLPLPTGAATEAGQVAIAGYIDGIETLLSGTLAVSTGLSQPLTDAQLRASAVPVSGTFWQTTQPVSVASLPLPTGASTSINQDTLNTRVGDVTESAPGSDTATSGLNGRLQRIAQRLTSLIGQLPATLGIKTAANSLSVAPASDAVFATYGSLTIPPHDYISNTWTDGNLTQVVYKTGGAAGTTVATLTMTYDGSNNLLTVTKS